MLLFLTVVARSTFLSKSAHLLFLSNFLRFLRPCRHLLFSMCCPLHHNCRKRRIHLYHTLGLFSILFLSSSHPILCHILLLYLCFALLSLHVLFLLICSPLRCVLSFRSCNILYLRSFFLCLCLFILEVVRMSSGSTLPGLFLYLSSSRIIRLSLRACLFGLLYLLHGLLQHFQ